MRGCRPATDTTLTAGAELPRARPAPLMSMMSRTRSLTLHFPNTGRTSRHAQDLWPPVTRVKLTLMTPSSRHSSPGATTLRPPPRPSTCPTTENKNFLLQHLQLRRDLSSLTPVYLVLHPLLSLAPLLSFTTYFPTNCANIVP